MIRILSILFAIYLIAPPGVVAQDEHNHTKEDCEKPPIPGSCEEKVEKYFYDKDKNECSTFQSCNDINGNNFHTLEECKDLCLKNSTTDEAEEDGDEEEVTEDNESTSTESTEGNVDEGTEEPDAGNGADNGTETTNEKKGLGDLLVILNGNSMTMDTVDFDNDSTGSWTMEGMKVVQVVSAKQPRGASQLDKKEDVSDEEDDDVGDDNATPLMTKVATPKEENSNGTLSRKITITDERKVEVKFALKVQGFFGENLSDGSSNETLMSGNPSFSLILEMENGTSTTLFDIKDFGQVFERAVNWTAIKYLFSTDMNLDGNYTLKFVAKQGDNENRTVFLDDIVFSETQMLNEEIAKDMDETFTTTTTTYKPTTTPLPTTETPDNATTSQPVVTEPPPTARKANNSAVVVLAIIVIVLLVSLVAVSVKYVQLKRDVTGTYSVNRSSGASAYPNQAYSGSQSGDRYGTLNE